MKTTSDRIIKIAGAEVTIAENIPGYTDCLVLIISHIQSSIKPQGREENYGIKTETYPSC